MGAADTARLIAELSLKDKFTGPSNKVLGQLGKLEGGFDRIGAHAQRGAQNFARNVGLIGIAAVGGIAVAVKSGLNDLATLESAITSVDGAIAQLGLTGQITGKQVAGWANDIESDIGAAFDDKDITAAATTLLRFGKVTPKNLEPALVVMTDLAAKTGDIDSAASLLAKALADPAKAAGKLARQGIILTKAQQDQLKEMVKVNDTAGAQALLLDAVAKSTKGAALASQGPYQRALSTLNDVAEDARKALAEGFLPVIEKVASRLSKAVGDPKFIAGLRDFGTQLAGGLDDLIDIAAKLPWTTIGDSLKLAGAGARAVLGAFTSLPPWIQTAVITGWGLNKLTGGALGSIVAELGKGLVKGVLGINAGVVNIKAGVVNGVGGGLPGVAGPAAGGGAALGVTAGLAGVGVAAAVGGAIGGAAAHAATEILDPALQKAIDQGATPLANRDPRRFDKNGNVIANLEPVTKKLDEVKGQVSQASVRSSERSEQIRMAVAAANASRITDSRSEISAVNKAAVAAQNQVAAQKAAQSAITGRLSEVRGAIARQKLSVTVPVTIKNNISIQKLTEKQQILKKFYIRPQ